MKYIPLTRGKPKAIVDDDDFTRFGHLNWYTQTNGYAARTIPGTKSVSFLHNEIMGVPPGSGVDHIDRNKLNNSKDNLRIVPRGHNNHNTGAYKNNTSGYKGVSYRKESGMWRAHITSGGKIHTIGSFNTKEDAARAYNQAAIEVFGSAAYQNIIE